MPNLNKYALSQMKGMTSHYSRESKTHSNKNIDASRTQLNYNLSPTRNQMEYIKQKLEEIPHAKRKDLKVACTWCISAPRELPEHLTRRFFETTYSFLIKRYGEKSGLGENVCVSAHVHMDETTPHMHFCMLPVIKDKDGLQRFCCKKLITQTELKRFHNDLDKHLQQNGISIRTQNQSTLYKRIIDKNGNEKFIALSPSELKSMRGYSHSFEVERSF